MAHQLGRVEHVGWLARMVPHLLILHSFTQLGIAPGISGFDQSASELMPVSKLLGNNQNQRIGQVKPYRMRKCGTVLSKVGRIWR